jgi:NDP-sugar pyrophosphorylase family protein
VITAIVLAGAHVWHEDSLDSLCPRALLPLANQPLIRHIFQWLHAADIPRAVVCANELDARLLDALEPAAQPGLRIEYYQDRLPRGPSGCARDAAELAPAEHYVIVDGSILPGVGLHKLLTAHRAARVAATIVVNPVDPQTADPEYAPAGVTVVSHAALQHVPLTGYQDLKEMLFPRLYRTASAVRAYAAEQVSPRVSDLASYLAVHEWLLERLTAAALPAEYECEGVTLRHATARIASGVRLLGPVIVGAGALIEPGAIITGPTAIGRDARVGKGAVLARSVVWDEAVIGAGAIVSQSVVADGARIAPESAAYGAICRADPLHALLAAGA